MAIQDFTPPAKRAHEQISAETTPSVSASSTKCCCHCDVTHSSSGHSTGTSAMFEVAGAIEALSDNFLKPSSSANLTSPQWHGAAICLLKEDGDLSDNEQVVAIWLFSCKTSIADSCLSIKKKSTCTLFIQFKLLAIANHYGFIAIYTLCMHLDISHLIIADNTVIVLPLFLYLLITNS